MPMEKEKQEEPKIQELITINSTIKDRVASRLKYMETILLSIKNKSAGIRLLIKRVRQVFAEYENGKEIIDAVISLLCCLDASCQGRSEGNNHAKLHQAIAIALDVMENLGGKELPAKRGMKFDPRLHHAMGTEEVDLPDQTISEVVYRGFKVGEKMYYAWVMVACNPKEQREQQAQGEETPGVETDQQKQAEQHSQEQEIAAAKASGEKIEKKLGLTSYEDYQSYVRESFQGLSGDPRCLEWIKQHREELLSVFMVDFDPVSDKIVPLYSADLRGNAPCNPVGILRSLLLMAEFKETSIPRWVAKTRTEPLLAIVCGFSPGKTPAVGSYYHFFQRLENGQFERKCRHRILPSEQRQKRAKYFYRLPKSKPKKDQHKKELPPGGVLKKLRQDLKDAQDEPVPRDLERLLNEILLEVAVKVSAAKNLLGDIQKLTCAGDGSTLPSGGNPNGRPLCNCRKQGIFRCDHLRKCSDPDAAWGWDNQIKDYIFGYRFYQFVCGSAKHDLPLYISIAPANSHDAVMAMKALDRWQKSLDKDYPQMHIDRIALDAIHDATHFYLYLCDHNIRYAIPYAKPPASCLPLGKDGRMFTDKGVPICPGGLPMQLHGYDKSRRKIFRCPVKRGTRHNGKFVYVTHREECPQQAICQPQSPIGPFVNVPPDIDPRIHPAILRNSKEYNKLSDSRSTCERSNSMKKVCYRMAHTKSRVRVYAYIRLALTSILEHSRVWAREKLKKIEVTRGNVLSLFD